MKKGIKKLLCLMLVVAMASTVFTACSSGSKGPRVELKPMTEDVITLTYAFWEDKAIVDLIMEDWNALYPNITETPSFRLKRYIPMSRDAAGSQRATS